MWTPRRILLMLVGLAGLLGVYFVYSRFLGGIDGLPELPSAYLVDSGERPSEQLLNEPSATQLRLQVAFGANSLEAIDSVAYKFKLTDANKAIACGQPIFAPPGESSRFVVVQPFSVAFFSRPEGEKKDAPEKFTSFHSDRCRMEFAAPVASAQDLSKAKLVGMVLETTPDELSADPRRGRVEIFDNQGSRDQGQYLSFLTPGPVYYRDPNAEYEVAAAQALAAKLPVPPAPKFSPDVPHVRTSSPVEVVDRRNLPRALRSANYQTANASGTDLRGRGAIAAILHGETLPPPTIRSEGGMKIYLNPNDPDAADKAKKEAKDAGKDGKAANRNATGFSSVRLVELGDRVLFALWADGGAGFPGSDTGKTPSDPAPQAAVTPKAAPLDPPAALGALAGGLADGRAVADKFANRSLLLVETLGGFRYDFGTNTATFEAAASADPVLSNPVTVTRLFGGGRQDLMFCQRMVVELDDGKADAAPPGTPAKPVAKAARPDASSGLKIKTLTATGDHVFLSVPAENLIAQGVKLVYQVQEQGKRTLTTLSGFPVTADRDQSRITSGDVAKDGRPAVEGKILLTTSETALDSVAANGAVTKGVPTKRTTINVDGAGRIQIHDSASNAKTLSASWGRSLTHERVLVGKSEQDLLKFEGGAMFVDASSDMKLRGTRLWLWLAPAGSSAKKDAPVKTEAAGSAGMLANAVPQRLDALGAVEVDSPDLVIDKTDQLQLWFRDGEPPAAKPKPPVAVAATPPAPVNPVAPVVPPGATPPPPVAVAEKPPQPPAKSNPTRLSARKIDATLVRYPVGAAPDTKPAAPLVALGGQPKPTQGGGLKYEMERALCEDRVVAHQDPADPVKQPKGLDIAGDVLILNATRIEDQLGQVMTVKGTVQNPAQVHFEGISLFGPQVVIDQLNNSVAIDGAGKLLMPSNSDFGGNPTEKPGEMEVKFTQRMLFRGAKANAEFLGLVNATQRPSRDAAAIAPAPKTVPIATQAPGAKPAADDGGWNLSRLFCHRLDVTFDRPIYFNQFRRTPGTPGAATGTPGTPGAVAANPAKPGAKPDAKPEGPAKLKYAKCTPLPDDEIGKLANPLQQRVTYTDEAYTKDNRLVRAQRLDAQEIEVAMKENRQDLVAAGPGELRMLQPDTGDIGRPAPPKPKAAPGQPAPSAADTPFKLTYVKFTNRMVGFEEKKLYQQATFTNGARVWNVPTRDVNLVFAEHKTPVGTSMLACDQSLVVSSSRADAAAEPEQRLEATGNGEFANDTYEGFANTITYNGQDTVFQGAGEQLAHFYKRQRANAAEGTSGKTITYSKNGAVRGDGVGAGLIKP